MKARKALKFDKQTIWCVRFSHDDKQWEWLEYTARASRRASIGAHDAVHRGRTSYAKVKSMGIAACVRVKIEEQ